MMCVYVQINAHIDLFALSVEGTLRNNILVALSRGLGF